MSQRRTISAPMQALYRVFVLPSLQQTATRPIAVQRTAIGSASPSSRYPKLQLQQASPFSTSARCLATRPPEKRTQLWDEEITAYRIQVVCPETKSLLPPERLRSVLFDIDRKTHRVVCVTAPPPRPQDREEAQRQREEWIPTCRIVSKKEQYEADKLKQKQKVQAKKNSADNVKTIELNWAIDGNDLAHRMKKAEEFLREGRKVEVVLAKRKGGRRATVDECQGVVDKILAVVEGVEGAKVLKKMEGKLGAVATLFFEGPKKAKEVNKVEA